MEINLTDEKIHELLLAVIDSAAAAKELERLNETILTQGLINEGMIYGIPFA